MGKITVYFLNKNHEEVFPKITCKNIDIFGVEKFEREKNADFSIEIFSNAFRGTSSFFPGKKESEKFRVINKNCQATLENNILKICCGEVHVHIFDGVITCSYPTNE